MLPRTTNDWRDDGGVVTRAWSGTRVLIVEDMPWDRQLVRHALNRGGLDCVTQCVETEPEFRQALEDFRPDLILTDYSLPRFSGLRAFGIIKELGLDTPVILVSGAVTEDTALECLKSGFADYLLKDNLLRLAPAVTATLESWQLRRQTRNAQDATRMSERRLNALVDAAPDSIIVMDAQGAVISFNPSALETFGYSLDDVHGKQLKNLIMPREIGDQHHDFVEHNLETGRTNVIGGRREVLAQRSDGTVFPAELAAVRLETEDAPVFASFLRDLSAQEKAEQMLRRSNIIVDSSSSMLAMLDRDYNYLAANPAYLEKFGKTEDLVIGRSVVEVFGQEMFDTVRPYAERCMKGAEVNFQCWFDFPAGRRFMDVTYRPYCDEQDEIQGFVVNAQDITKLVCAEEERSILTEAIEHAVDAVLIADQDGTIRYVNPAFESISGYTSREVLGEHRRILDSGREEPSFFEEIRKRLERGEAWAGRIINRKKDGTHYEADATISPVHDADGTVVRYVFVARDVTLEVELEAELVQGRRMEAVGRLVGGIAHDFNNILAAALGYTQLAQESVDSEGETSEYLVAIEKACRRAADLVSQLLAFSRREKTALEPIKFAVVVEEALSLLRKAVPATIAFEFETDGEHLILADDTQIHQVVMNLGLNAYHAMREQGGTLSVRLDTTELGEGSQTSDVQAGRYARLTMSDTGCGMDDTTLDHLFEPYFTTKEVGEGSGLGLATVRGIVEQHAGTVRVASVLGQGSTFEVYLPLYIGPDYSADPDPDRPTTDSDDPIPRGNGEHVLVVDDEPAIVDVLGAMLKALGYVVSFSHNGIEAMDLFRANPDQFDIVITDQTMPGLTGLEMGMEMLRVRPSLPIILCTGYSEQVGSEAALASGIRDYLTKPVSAGDLARRVRLGLDEPGPAAAEDN